MKRFVALLLVVVIAATALNLVAIAYSDSDSGVYNGKSWSASISLNNGVHSSIFTVSGGGFVAINTGTRIYPSNNPNNKFWDYDGDSSANGTASYYYDYQSQGFVPIEAYMTYMYKSLSGTLSV